MTPIKQLIIAGLIASTLSGCATAIIGGAAAGANSIANRRTIGTQFDDETTEMHIRTNAYALIKQNNANSTATLSVISYNRKVLLLGQVPSEIDKQLAEQAARNEPQVQNVYNYINVSSEPRTVANINYDTWLTSKLRSKLLTVYPGHVKVVSFNSVVYVFGLLTPEQQTLVSNTVSSVSGVQQVVTLYETYTPASVQSTPAQ